MTDPPPPRPVDAAGVAAAAEALAAARTAGAVLVLDLDRVHLLTPGRERGPAALERILAAVDRRLDGRAPWLRLADDVVVAFVPGAADRGAADALARDLVAAAQAALAAEVTPLAATPVCGRAWSPLAGAGLLPTALRDAWARRHDAPADAGSPVGSPADAGSRAGSTGTGAAARPASAEATAAAGLDTFLVELSQQSLGWEPARFLAGLHQVLAALVRVIDVDYAFVDVLEPDGITVRNLAGADVTAEGDFVRSEGRRLTPDDPWWAMLAALEPVAVADQFASHGGDHPANHPSGDAARAFVNIPFVVGGAIAGLLGVGIVDRARDWSRDEITGLRLVTGLVGAVLERDRIARSPAP